MKNKKKILSKYKRKVIVDGEEWTWRATKSTFHICNPERTKKWMFGHGGWSPCDCNCHRGDYFEKYEACGTCYDGCPREHAHITPRDIARIARKIRNGERVQ